MEEEQPIVENEQESQKLAMVLECVKAYIPMVNIDYSKQCIKGMHDQANWQDSAAVLASHYDPTKSDLLHLQANTLDHFIKFIQGLIECQKLKVEVAGNKAHFEKIDKMFL